MYLGFQTAKLRSVKDCLQEEKGASVKVIAHLTQESTQFYLNDLEQDFAVKLDLSICRGIHLEPNNNYTVIGEVSKNGKETYLSARIIKKLNLNAMTAVHYFSQMKKLLPENHTGNLLWSA